MEKFNQIKYQNQWKKERYKLVGASFKNEFVEEFRKSCQKLGVKQSEIFKKAMEEVIEKAK